MTKEDIEKEREKFEAVCSLRDIYTGTEFSAKNYWKEAHYSSDNTEELWQFWLASAEANQLEIQRLTKLNEVNNKLITNLQEQINVLQKGVEK